MKLSSRPNAANAIPPSGLRGILSRHKKKVASVLGAVGIVAATGQYMKAEQASIDERHEFLNATFSLESLSPDRQAREMIFTTLYPEFPFGLGKIQGRSHKIPVFRNFVKRVPKTGGILLRPPDMQSMGQIRATTAAIRTENPTAIVAMDFEGGYIRFPNLSAMEKEKYKFPKRLFELREKEVRTYVTDASDNRLGQFPSAEFLGKEYESMKSPEMRAEFLEIVRKYGLAVGYMMSDIGVHLVLGPSFDTANHIGGNGENPLSKNDRSFGTDHRTVSDIGNAFVRGIRSVPGVGAVAKHFVGTGFTKKNTDMTEGGTGNMETAILPFMNFVNEFEVAGFTPNQAVATVKSLSPGWNIYEASIGQHDEAIAKLEAELRTSSAGIRQLGTDLKQAKKKAAKWIQAKIGLAEQRHKDIQTRLSRAKTAKEYAISVFRTKIRNIEAEKTSYAFNTPMIMNGNNANNFYAKKGVPGVFSRETVAAIRKGVGVSKTGKRGGMGENGIVMSDDLMAGGPKDFVRRISDGGPPDRRTARAAFDAGNDILLYNDTQVDTVVGELRRGNPDQLRKSVKRILDLKADLGILQKDATWRYSVSPRAWNVTPDVIKRDGLYSHQWPWLIRNDYYRQEGGNIKHVSMANTVLNATKNLILNQCRVDPGMLGHLCALHPGMYETYRSPNEASLRKKLIVVDKEFQKLRVYDLETRKFIEEFPIGIGKGTDLISSAEDKRVSGDSKTPSGYYQVVQKKDPALIRKTIEPTLYREYGGDGGAMLVLGGPWAPQIAIHGTLDKATGPVSHGCVRATNEIANHLMNTVAIGSIVVITK